MEEWVQQQCSCASLTSRGEPFMQVAIVGLDIAKRESRTAHRKVWKDLAHHQERSSVDFIRAESSGHAVAGVNPDFIGQEGQRLPALARSFGTDFVRTCALFPAAGAGPVALPSRQRLREKVCTLRAQSSSMRMNSRPSCNSRVRMLKDLEPHAWTYSPAFGESSRIRDLASNASHLSVLHEYGRFRSPGAPKSSSPRGLPPSCF